MSAIVRRPWRRTVVDLEAEEYVGRHRRGDAAPTPSPIPAGHTRRNYGLAAWAA